ncbi:ABC transporter substrate-binding protein [Methylobacillus gramineus]|uniref:ABC transporter substrate-binding protein n=1 Tax=Methylobacillus gramineus TaxID=755169 RepID=UPI001CFF590E|nr:ABC transporter substrate-binding protein [Methylobacillus gramineus]MCB5184410.1 ABC transporter substrate-binding protein [Methylobacillus gramineus]
MTDSYQPLSQIWFTRCPVPTATGLAYQLGWLTEEFAKDNIKVSTLQEGPREYNRHHYDHQLPTLIREGGSLLAIAARAQFSPTRLIGLTWIDEWQAILVRPGSGINKPEDLKGKRLALPAFVDHPIRDHVRGSSIARGMSLHGYKGALGLAGLTLDDADLVEVAAGRGRGDARRSREVLGGLWAGLDDLITGNVDAVYVKGASAVEAAKRVGAVVGIDLDSYAELGSRVNNGTPRPITVHEDLLENHFDLVVRFMYQTLRAADWAKNNLNSLRTILQDETFAGADGVSTAYRNDFHLHLEPSLSPERIALFRKQKNFMWIHGLLDRDFDLDAWVDQRPLLEAQKWLNEKRQVA